MKYVCPFPPFDIQKLQCDDATNYVAMIPISWIFLDFLGGGNSYIFGFHPEPWGKDDPQFDLRIFFKWVGEKPPTSLGGGFKYFLFLPLFGEDSHFD